MYVTVQTDSHMQSNIYLFLTLIFGVKIVENIACFTNDQNRDTKLNVCE